jgi:hypothetical protein
VIGTGALVAAMYSIVGGARYIRQRSLPDWSGAPACLVVGVLSLTLVTMISEILGSVALLRIAPLTIALGGTGIAVHLLARRAPAPQPTPSATGADVPIAPAPNAYRRARRLATAAVLLVSAEWLAATVRSFRIGMTAVDATWYHMPTAARFAQSGSTWKLHVIDTSSLTVFYPAGSELLHAVGMVFVHTDALSHVLNLGWLALALLAAWCIGARYGVGPVTLLGAALLMSTPQLVALEAGQALNDIAVTALLLAAAALIVQGVASDAGRFTATMPLVVAAMAAGLAAGTKWTALVSVTALTVGIPFLSKRSERVKNTAIWIGVAALSGGYWYLRDLTAAGSPVPPQRLGLGPIQFPYAPPGISTFSLTHYLTDSATWHHVIFPGLRSSFGPLWWGVLFLAASGLALGPFLTRNRGTRVAAVVGIACVLSYLVTKQGFTINFWPGTPRYAAPGLALGLVILPLTLARVGRPAVEIAMGAYAVLLVVTQLDSQLWRNWWSSNEIAIAASIGAIGIAAIGAAGWRARRHQLARLPLLPIALVTLLGLSLVSGVALASYHQVFADHGTPGEKAASILRARHVRHSRIALTGSLLVSGSQYAFYDKRLTNYVQFIAEPGPHHREELFTSCAPFLQAVAAGRYQYVVTPAATARAAGPATWLQVSGSARRLDDRKPAGASVFEITGPLEPRMCGNRS